MKETDLYPPVKAFLQAQGYEVKGEVGDCDLVAVRGAEAPVIVELKLVLNMDLLLQCVERLAATPKVYVGVPVRSRLITKRRRRVLRLLRMLGLGLITVDPKAEPGGVEVLLDPSDYKPRKSKQRQERLLGEFVKRVGDPNLGGADRRRGIMTAYRQRAIGIGAYLERNGPTKASRVARDLCEPKARDILYRNVYGWFERAEVGVYQLSPRGGVEIPGWQQANAESDLLTSEVCDAALEEEATAANNP